MWLYYCCDAVLLTYSEDHDIDLQDPPVGGSADETALRLLQRVSFMHYIVSNNY